MRAIKILQIGNYPPPFCGWAVQTKLLVEEIRKRTECRTRPQEPLFQEAGDNIAKTADWLLANVCRPQHQPEKSFAHVQ